MAVAQTSLSSFIAPGSLEKERLSSLSIFRQAVLLSLCLAPSETASEGQLSLTAVLAPTAGEKFTIRFEDVQRTCIDGLEAQARINEVRSEVYYSSRTKVSRVKLMFEGDEWAMSFTCGAIIVVEQ